MSGDPIFTTFLRENHRRGMALSESSDILQLEPVVADPPTKYVATYRCPILVRRADGAIVESEGAVIGIWFPPNYLRGPVNFFQVATWLGPEHPWHPNIHANAPFMCVGSIFPGTDLVTLLHHVYEICVWMNFATDDALNGEACQWARNQDPARFPLDRRPLKRAATTAGGAR